MAKTTFEKNLKELLDQNLIFFEKHKNMKLYHVSEIIPSHEKQLLDSLDAYIDKTRKQLETSTTNFSKYSKIRKNSIIMPLFRSILHLEILIRIVRTLFGNNTAMIRKKQYDKLIAKAENLLGRIDRGGLSLAFTFFWLQGGLLQNELQKYLDAPDSMFKINSLTQ